MKHRLNDEYIWAPLKEALDQLPPNADDLPEDDPRIIRANLAMEVSKLRFHLARRQHRRKRKAGGK